MRDDLDMLQERMAPAQGHSYAMPISVEDDASLLTESGEVAADAGEREAPVYLISDNALRAEDSARQLRNAGYTVDVIERIAELLQRVAIRPPSAVVIELEHEKVTMDGLAAIVEARRAGYARFPIVWISSRHHFDASLMAARAGVDFYLTRPVDFLGLCDRLRQLVNAREGAPHRVLVVTDDRARTEPYVALLRTAHMEVRRLDRLRDLLQVMDDYRPEVVLADIDLPRCSNADVARLIRQRPMHFDVPLIFLSADAGPAAQVEAAQAGADDVLAMPAEPALFVATLQHRAERHRALRALIMRDSLTGLYNHAAIKESLAHELARCSRVGIPLSLAMIDIDFFKKVNDSYGHPVGDQVIRSLSHLLRLRLRAGDLVGRYGGEEFAVILPGSANQAAAAVLDKIREAFAQTRHEADTREFTATFSAGVVDTGSHTDAAELLAAADAALYAAKHLGRNRIET